jgi:hypothetical protein
MRAIIINPKDRTITATDVDGSLDSLQQIVGGMIEPVSQGLDEYHHCYVNEEGLLDDIIFSVALSQAYNTTINKPQIVIVNCFVSIPPRRTLRPPGAKSDPLGGSDIHVIIPEVSARSRGTRGQPPARRNCDLVETRIELNGGD